LSELPTGISPDKAEEIDYRQGTKGTKKTNRRLRRFEYDFFYLRNLRNLRLSHLLFFTSGLFSLLNRRTTLITVAPVENPLTPAASRRSSGPAIATAAIFVGIFVVYFVLDCRRITQGHFGDFRHFYYAARALLDGADLYTSGTGGYIYPPLIALLYTPIAKLPYETAAVVMLAINCILAASAIRLAAGEFADRFDLPAGPALIWSIALLGAVLDIDKVRNEIQMLQTNALMLMMFVLALRWLDRRPLLAGIALGVVFNIKYLSLAMLPYLIVRRRWKTLGAFVASAVGFAFLPAMVDGWQANLRSLRIAFGGLLHMVGAGAGEQANVEDITAMFSSSITSAMARLSEGGLPMSVVLLLVAAIALATLGIVIFLYRREGFSLFRWPVADEQTRQPYRGIVGLEWAGLVTAALVFSPQTNTRHLFLALLVTVPTAALLLGGRGKRGRTILALATIIAFLGFILPPGRRPVTQQSASYRWTAVGGACWCLLMLFLTMLSEGLRQLRTKYP
jgi:hypothetical protein